MSFPKSAAAVATEIECPTVSDVLARTIEHLAEVTDNLERTAARAFGERPGPAPAQPNDRQSAETLPGKLDLIGQLVAQLQATAVRLRQIA